MRNMVLPSDEREPRSFPYDNQQKTLRFLTRFTTWPLRSKRYENPQRLLLFYYVCVVLLHNTCTFETKSKFADCLLQHIMNGRGTATEQRHSDVTKTRKQET